MPDLRELARRALRREAIGHTLPPTAVIHEAFIRLERFGPSEWSSTEAFLRAASRAMRQVLIDHARRRHTARRHRPATDRITLSGLAVGSGCVVELLDFERALTRLEARSARQAELVALRVYGGLTEAEAAACLAVSRRTVSGDWQLARAFLRRELASYIEAETGPTAPPDPASP